MNPESGGVCEAIRNSIPAQTGLGVETEVLCFDAPTERFLRNDFFKINAIGPASGPYSYCVGLKSWLLENVSRFDIFIIHGLWLHNSFGTYQFWSWYRKRYRARQRLFVMPHGMLDPYFQKSRKRRLKAIRNWIFWKLVEQKVVNGSDGILFTCAEELELARRTFHSYKPKAELNVGLGIKIPPSNCDTFSSEFFKKCPQVEGHPYWLYLGRIHPKKGLDDLVKAYMELRVKRKKIPDLVIAGPGLETPFGRNLSKMSKGLPIYFPGMLKESAKWGAFYSSEVFLLPSHQENFGIAVVEALACGTAVLISNKVNIWREIYVGKAGLVAEDNKDNLYWILEKWLNMSASSRLAFAKNARELFEQEFQIDVVAQKTVGYLKDFLESKSI